MTDTCGLYIHVPFCRSRCVYCDFYSQTRCGGLTDDYVKALKREVEQRSSEAGELQTIYFGGGTPSVLSPSQLGDILQSVRSHFKISDDAEITLEVNPDDVVGEEWLTKLLGLGINRFSLGVQSFDDDVLHFIRRRHSAAQARKAVLLIDKMMSQHCGSNISIDLMYGLPQQSLAAWHDDVSQALDLPIRHMSSYSLTYENGTLLHEMLVGGRVGQVSDEMSLQMFRLMAGMMREAGFRHYEISNFARPGFESRHNSSYWRGVPYIGFGPGAHSYDGRRKRRWNVTDLNAYVGSSEAPCQYEILSENDLFNEKVMTRLRTAEGLDLAELSAEDRDYVKKISQTHIDACRLSLTGERLSLTLDGILTSDDIISDFIKI